MSSESDHGRPPSQRDIAKAAGVSLATVSLALRGAGAIPEATRARIQALALQMGYVANPLVSAFHQQIRARKTPDYRATLAWINDSPNPKRWDKMELYEASVARAEALGYRLDQLHLNALDFPEGPAALCRQFLRIMKARGIYGAILPDLWCRALACEDWEDVAVVLIGLSEKLIEHSRFNKGLHARYHTIAWDCIKNTVEAIQHMERMGARRIGMAVNLHWHKSNDFGAVGQYLVWQQTLPKNRRLPPLVLESVDAKAGALEIFREWFQTQRPDALLCANHEIPDLVCAAGGKIPGQVKIAHLNVNYEDSAWGGIDECPARQGAAAVDLVSAHLQRNERGVPDYPKTMFIPGVWRDGPMAGTA